LGLIYSPYKPGLACFSFFRKINSCLRTKIDIFKNGARIKMKADNYNFL